jgi:hypothetical protein
MDWKPFEYISLEQNISTEIKLVQTCWVHASAAGTKIVFYVRKPEDPAAEELKDIVVQAYNQAAVGLIRMLETDFRQPPSE